MTQMSSSGRSHKGSRFVNFREVYLLVATVSSLLGGLISGDTSLRFFFWIAAGISVIFALAYIIAVVWFFVRQSADRLSAQEALSERTDEVLDRLARSLFDDGGLAEFSWRINLYVFKDGASAWERVARAASDPTKRSGGRLTIGVLEGMLRDTHQSQSLVPKWVESGFAPDPDINLKAWREWQEEWGLGKELISTLRFQPRCRRA
ncbi:hypothetical protein ACH0BW_06795 [Micrococcus luteus]|uniref:hypothetical protein n=1 Tax=Micrococcus luteus TaxID=1270 RepID=UPI00387999A2